MLHSHYTRANKCTIVYYYYYYYLLYLGTLLSCSMHFNSSQVTPLLKLLSSSYSLLSLTPSSLLHALYTLAPRTPDYYYYHHYHYYYYYYYVLYSGTLLSCSMHLKTFAPPTLDYCYYYHYYHYYYYLLYSTLLLYAP